MSNLNGKKPFKGKYYQHKKNGWVGRVIQVEERFDTVFLLLKGDVRVEANLSTFYTHFGRLKDYQPVYKCPLENE